jgi:hypothetical protein
MIEKMLLSWRNRYVCLGGRVVLINSVLTLIPVFYLSFFKIQSKVRRTIVSNQRKFLCVCGRGALGEKDKISWVS